MLTKQCNTDSGFPTAMRQTGNTPQHIPKMTTPGATADLPLVTIGIPTYNRAHDTLPQALASAVAQTYPNLEIVVSDNCSEDNTCEVVAGFKDERVRYIRHPENIGANNNFNACVEHARGDYLLLLHDDDLIDENIIAASMEAAGHHTDVGIIVNGMRAIDGDGNTRWVKRSKIEGENFVDLIRAWFDRDTTMYCCNTLMHTETLREVGGFDSKHHLFQDVLAHVQVAAKRGFCQVPGVLATFRDHDESRGAVARISAWSEDSRDLLETIRSLCPPEHADEIYLAGQRFFCRMNYSRVLAAKPNPTEKLKLLAEVADMFGDAESKWRYMWQKELRPAIRGRRRRSD